MNRVIYRSGIVIMSLLYTIQVFPENDFVKFREISPKGGFTFGSIHEITEDKHGFIWLGSHHGLFRYNTEKVEKFVHDTERPNSIPSNYITSIAMDRNKQLWFASDNGIFNYNSHKANFECPNFYNTKNVPLHKNTTQLIANPIGGLWAISNNLLTCIDTDSFTYQTITPHPEDDLSTFIYLDDTKRLWLKSSKGKIYCSVSPYSEFSYFGEATNQPVQTMLYAQNKLWIGYETNGAECYSNDGKLVAKYGKETDILTNIKSDRVRKIIEDQNGNIWFGTYNGLSILHRNEQITFHNTNNTLGLKHSSIYDIFIDSKKGIWIGTWSGSLSYSNPYDNTFNYIGTDDGLSNKVISSITERNNILWIGTEGGGLNSFKTETNEIKIHILNPMLGFDQNIKALEFDQKGRLWIGTFNDGLWYIEQIDSNGFPKNPKKLLQGEFYDLQFDGENIWAATYFSGLYKINTQTFEYENYPGRSDNLKTVHTNHLRTLMIDSNEGLWIGTQLGINYKENYSEIFKRYLTQPNNTSNITVYTIFEDHNHVIWIGTSAGLKYINTNKNTPIHLIPYNKIPTHEIYGITEDNNNYLWLSTDKGIIQFNPEDDYLRLFTEKEGLQGNQFNPGAVYKSKDGILYFGGPNGLTFFQPKNIKINPIPPQPVIVDILINNQVQIPTDSQSIVSKSILTSTDLLLNHNQNSLTFYFVANNFLSPQKNSFAYRLLNYNDKWITNTGSSATFTKIPPGKYVFQLKAANNDGVWNEIPLEIKIKVNFPWWQKWYAWLSYVLFASISGWYVHYERRTKQKLLNKIYMEKIKRKNETELNNSKLTFFTNISHEIKTPLNLILSPLDYLKENRKNDPDLTDVLNTVLRNAYRLKQLLHQVIDIRRLEVGQLTCKKEFHDILPIIDNLLNCFILESKERNIQLIYETELDNISVSIDYEMFDRIVFNLLTNAFKFVSDNGIIRLDINKSLGVSKPLIGHFFTEEVIEIKVYNSDSYIPIENQISIFDKFYQLPNNKKQGTGIGLNMVKEYVLLHNGQVDIESHIDDGTTFFIRLPLIVGSPILKTTPTHRLKDLKTQLPTNDFFEINNDKSAKNRLILIVEDNTDLRAFLRKILSSKHSIITAPNGKIGYEQAVNLDPDLIISDVLMPEMDGFKLCELIKSDINTNHIPVILLTALSTEENQIQGYNKGADAYICKPFSENLLQTQINNLLNMRRKLRDKFLNPETVLSINEYQDPNISIISHAEALIQEHLLDSNLTVEVLADKLKVSRATLHRKIKAQTDYSTTEFIRFIRLKAAINMIKTGKYPISEIAYNTGFSSPSYFSSSFRKQFGKTPKEYYDDIHNKEH